VQDLFLDLGWPQEVTYTRSVDTDRIIIGQFFQDALHLETLTKGFLSITARSFYIESKIQSTTGKTKLIPIWEPLTEEITHRINRSAMAFMVTQEDEGLK